MSNRRLQQLVTCAAFAGALIARPGAVRSDERGEDAGTEAEAQPIGGATSSLTSPPPETLRACSFRRDLCVHGSSGPQVLVALASVERTWDLAVGPLALPPPERGLGSGVYDVYLVPILDSPGMTYLRERDLLGTPDRASAFSIVDARLGGASLDRALARELFRAIAFRTIPGTDETTARAEASALTRLAVPSALAAPDGAEILQAHPERGLYPLTRMIPEGYRRRAADGAGIFFTWLDDTYAQRPGGVVRALWALSWTRSPKDASTFAENPDAFDILRENLKGALSSGSTINDVLLAFAVARAFTGNPLSESAELGAIGAPLTADFDLAWPATGTTRSVAMSAGLAPTGTTTIRIRRAGAPAGTRLRVEIKWEELAKLRWMALKLDATGAITQRLPFGVADKATECALSIGELDASESVVLVGTNVSTWDAPFDPDTTPLEPHGWVVAYASE
ncbi:hypothetical protein BH09MYX1_BH09MYX1_29530 [soil metagenome]